MLTGWVALASRQCSPEHWQDASATPPGLYGRRSRPSGVQASCSPHRIIRLYPIASHLLGIVGVDSISGLIEGHFPAVAAGANRWRLLRWAAQVAKIAALEPELLPLSDEQLRKRSLSLRYRAKSGEALARLLVEAYALVREAGRRTINMRHFDVQILGGIAMFHRSVVEMQTGEGKTLAATLPMYLYALERQGLPPGHGERLPGPPRRRMDAAGLRGPGADRRRGGDANVAAAAAQGVRLRRDLRDGEGIRLRFSPRPAVVAADRRGARGFLGRDARSCPRRRADENPVQGPPYFALVDEADSILIDEARTPLIISALPTEEQKLAVECHRWSASVTGEFVEDEDYEYDHEKKKAELTGEGRQKIRLLPKPETLDAVGMVNIYELHRAGDHVRSRVPRATGSSSFATAKW